MARNNINKADNITVVFKTPSLQRLLCMIKGTKDKSLLRCLEYERLSGMGLRGRILDFGGGEKTNYSHLRDSWMAPGCDFIYESANIDPHIQPTYLIGDDGKIPVPSAYFNAVISINTLEHIYNLVDAIVELNRVLKPGGALCLIVPFVFKVHGHPDDYLRGTPSFWYTTLKSHGFENIKIDAITWGPFSTGVSISGLPGPFKNYVAIGPCFLICFI